MHTRLLAIFAALFLVLAPTAESLAKSSGSRSSFSSRGSSSGSGWSSSSRSSSGWSGSSKSSGSSSGWSSSSKPSGSSSGWSGTSRPSDSGSSGSSGWGASRQAAPSSSPSSGSGWSNSSGASQSSSARPGSGSAFSSSGSGAVKRQASTSSYRDYQGRFGKSGNAVSGNSTGERPILNPNRSFNSYGDYNRYRDNYYSGRGWSAPGYAFGSYSSFGMWDAMFMWFMLSHLTSGSSFFYNHQSDPGVQAFQKEAQRMAESNADLKKQVDELNAKLDDMKKSGVAPDPNTPLPADVDPNVALAKPKIAESSPGGGWLLPATAALAAILAIGYFMTRRRSA